MIRVLIVDDSTFFRKALVKVLSLDPEIQVVGEATGGMEALSKIASLHPDLVTLDIDMPGMNGLDVLRRALADNPQQAVIMLSALSREGADITLEALSLGAVDFIDKTHFSLLDFDKLAEELLFKVKIWRPRSAAGDRPLARLPLTHGATAGSSAFHPPPAKPRLLARRPHSLLQVDWERFDLCAIGTSTGGPPALEAILRQVDPHFPKPIAIVQHMPQGFTHPFAERLNRLCPLEVLEAEEGIPLEPGRVIIARAGNHMTIDAEFHVRLSEQPAEAKHIPSVDVLFHSLAEIAPARTVAVLLTGMGEDGAEGMYHLYQQGSLTIAESEETCVVFGMPHAAHRRGAVRHLLPLEAIVQIFSSAPPRDFASSPLG